MSERVKKRNQAKVYGLRCVNLESFDGIRKNSTVLVTGDAWTLPEDVKRFESFGVPHDGKVSMSGTLKVAGLAILSTST